MKKAYNAPQLTIHGSVENITNAFGTPGANDTFEVNGQSYPASLIGLTGSQPGIVVPKP
ncbi:lasso peptide [Anabaena sp. CA = ATCC 33047]|uniref:lasso peptide n=1 Tax=Anabaena sp. (strain CA / ATCC 33047) TaxID=52271 RepID=UPI000A946329|nr:lasso peptide [Anabaena sp. CA = ATCC 33047]